MDKSSEYTFDDDIGFYMGFSLDFHYGDYDLLFPQGRPSGKYHVVFLGIFQKASIICVKSTFFLFTYVFSIFSFPSSCFHVKVPNGNHRMSTFVSPVGDFTQMFVEIFSDGWDLFRDCHERSISNK